MEDGSIVLTNGTTTITASCDGETISMTNATRSVSMSLSDLDDGDTASFQVARFCSPSGEAMVAKVLMTTPVPA